jgi:hypothetical protein
MITAQVQLRETLQVEYTQQALMDRLLEEATAAVAQIQTESKSILAI